MTKVVILIENEAKEGFLHEHGLSFAINYKSKKLIFDVGASDNFLINAAKLHIDLSEYKDIVLSHSHWDHTNGLKYLNNKRIIAHESVFNPMFSKRTDEYIGTPLTMEEAKVRFDLRLTKKPIQIFDDIFFLGEIPRINNFESQQAYYYDKSNEDDFVLSDSAIAIKRDNKIDIVTGCSHSGIVNIIQDAKEVCNVNKVGNIIGGFHLRKLDEVAKETVNILKLENGCVYYPMHCTSNEVIDYMKDVIGEERVIRKVAGEIINLS
jgi:7,8-dihydropterin-6-yl-methyl-4-(beta-D-ribofuranosyl)aminobenzene 5'-phosphate synthase